MHLLTKCVELFFEKQNVGSARRVTLSSQKGVPASWVTLLAEPTFCRSLYVSGKLATYPSPKPTLTLTSQLRAECWLSKGGGGGGRMGNYPQLDGWPTRPRHPFCRVTPLAGLTTFRPVNTLANLAGSTRSRRENQSIHERCFRQSQHAHFFLDVVMILSTFPRGLRVKRPSTYSRTKNL